MNEPTTNRSQMDKLVRLSDVKALFHRGDERTFPFSFPGLVTERDVESIPAVDAVEVPGTGIGDLSDGYHTFNGLYHQRLILFAALVKAYKDRAWKSYRHEDGELCFGGGWFIVGIDTPEGSYTYHYENKDFDLFDCEELPVGKHWDGHTEDDVTRLLSLAVDAVEVVHGEWVWDGYVYDMPWQCSVCRGFSENDSNYCPHCGARMDGEEEHNAVD